MDWQEVLGLTAGCCTSSCMLPQLIKVVKEKDASNIALGMLLLLMAGLSLWVWYGIERKDIPIITTNSFSILLTSTLIVLRFRYGEKGK